MRRLVFLFCVVMGAAATARASLPEVRGAQAMLGRDVWSQVVRVENENPRSRYPATVWALVFEFNGLLWFYCPTDGTQSFSLHTNRLAEEKADFAPGLRDIDAGFVRYRRLPDGPPPARARNKVPPNACFIQSMVALREMVHDDPSITDAALLGYYVEDARGRRGHTVLLLGRETDSFAVVDAQRANRTVPIPERLTDDPLAVARWVESPAADRVVAARWVPAGQMAAPEFASLEQRRIDRELKADRARIATMSK